MCIFEKIFNFLLLDKETICLEKINELAKQVNKCMDTKDLSSLPNLKEEFLKINTKKHKSKIEFYIYIIDSLCKQ